MPQATTQPPDLVAPNLVAITPRLVSSGQPSAQALSGLGALGFEAVIYLAPPTVSDAVRDEALIVGRQSMESEQIMSLPKPPPQTFFGFAKLPARYAGLVMPFLLSVLMTCIVSLVSTLHGVGVVQGLLRIWLGAWAVSWVIAFPVLLLLLPVVRKVTAAIVDVA